MVPLPIWICSLLSIDSFGAFLNLKYLGQVGLAPLVVAGIHVKAVELVPVSGFEVIARNPPYFEARIGDSLPLLQDTISSHKLKLLQASNLLLNALHHLI